LLPNELSNGTKNPARSVAIFTVHGIGDQRHAETANAMRVGFERAAEVNELDADCGVPYVHDGWWGNYDDFAASMPEVASQLSDEERDEIADLFRARSLSGMRTMAWFGGRFLRMVSLRTLVSVGLVRYLTYVLMGALSLVGMVILLVRMPRVMRTIVNDVRLYGGPEGDTERGICENIDRRVAAALLRLFGLDLRLDPLPVDQRIHLEGRPVTFDTVVWVSHSLGTVISYNTLIDVIDLCRTATLRGEGAGATDADRRRADAARRVVGGLHRFITMGSPLQKATFLFETALREEDHAAAMLRWLTAERTSMGRVQDEWWMNFFLVMDPVSGRLLHEHRFAPFVCNIHPSRVGVPAACHTVYWSDTLVASPILSRALGKDVFPYAWANARWSDRKVQTLRVLTSLVLIAALIGSVVYGVRTLMR
jgi:hypothetical protein